LPQKFDVLKLLSLAGILALSACATQPAPSGINDPNEKFNRSVHAFNVGLDKTLVRPAASAYGAILPTPIERGVSNFANNLDAPGQVLNHLLQGKPQFAMQNTLRFALNTTAGIGGLFDFSTAIGLPGVETDFGETLHVWGAPEGNYVELPGFGPSTSRDAAGIVVDLVMNPASAVLPELPGGVSTAAQIGSKLGDRDRFSSTVDSLLYESADSYAQLRLLYLQKRRYELGQTDAESDATFVDPYEDPYAE
jgi:phospholipid-binding lipoprotein MlaA